MLKRISYKFQKFLGNSLIRVVEFFISISTVNKSVFNEEEFPELKKIKLHWLDIKKEYITFSSTNKLDYMSDIFEEQIPIAPDDTWENVMLKIYNQDVLKYKQYFPLTTSLINSIPEITTAFFSTLKSEKKISEHRGPFKGLLRYHLGVIVPECNSCFLNLNGKKHYWKEGEVLIFDDTFIHSAENNSQEERVVLFIDFYRPLIFPLNLIVKLIVFLISKSEYIQRVVRKIN